MQLQVISLFFVIYMDKISTEAIRGCQRLTLHTIFHRMFYPIFIFIWYINLSQIQGYRNRGQSHFCHFHLTSPQLGTSKGLSQKNPLPTLVQVIDGAPEYTISTSPGEVRKCNNGPSRHVYHVKVEGCSMHNQLA